MTDRDRFPPIPEHHPPSPGDVPQGPLPEGEETAPRGAGAASVVRWLLVIAMALAAAAALLWYFGAFEGTAGSPPTAIYFCPMHPAVVQDHPGSCPICGMDLVPRGRAASAAPATNPVHGAAPSALPFVCPMHPEEGSTDPAARCAQCGMALAPNQVLRPAALAPGVAGTGDSPAGRRTGPPRLAPVALTPERIQLAGLRTAQVVRESLSPSVRAVGTVAAPENAVAEVQARFAGWIEELFVAETGQRVERGQVVATIYSPDLLQAQEELLAANRWSREATDAALAANLAGDARRRLELLGISAEEIEELVRSKTPRRALPLRSPVSGFVARRGVVPGAYVTPGAILLEVTDLSRVWVIAEVYESELARVRTGQRARVSFAAWPGLKFAGQVTQVYPGIDPRTRTLRVRLELANPGLRLLPGMFGEVLLDAPPERGLFIPREALVETGETRYVFVAHAGGHFEPRAVEIGARAGDKVLVLAGLAEGETVVTTGNFLLDSESRLRAAIEGSTGAVAPRRHEHP